jgi:hypothetical protein
MNDHGSNVSTGKRQTQETIKRALRLNEFAIDICSIFIIYHKPMFVFHYGQESKRAHRSEDISVRAPLSCLLRKPHTERGSGNKNVTEMRRGGKCEFQKCDNTNDHTSFLPRSGTPKYFPNANVIRCWRCGR